MSGSDDNGGSVTWSRWRGSSRLAQVTAALSVLALVVSVGTAIALWRARGTACTATEVARMTMASVVTINVRSGAGDVSNGSGEFLDTSGNILTNNHVISSAVPGGAISVLRPNGVQLTARLLGRDNDTDLAVVHVDPESAVAPIQFGSQPHVGDPVFAVGAPLGLSDTITAGVVGATGRSVRVPADAGTTALLPSAIQTDASINPGNSGGTLADCSGKLVGVPTAGATANDASGRPVAGSIGLGFAIPGDFAQKIADQLLTTGRAVHGNPGVAVVPVAAGPDATTISGLQVILVTPGGAGAQAGLQPGDVLTRLDGNDITSADQLQATILTRGPGSKVDVEYRRAGSTMRTTLTMG